jgi:uncharacterized membrane protein YvlD (DUF360 family)
MKKQKINHLAVWVSIVLSQVIPLLWFQVFRFTPFYESLGQRVTQDFSTPALYGIGFLAGIVSMYLLEGLFIRLDVDSTQDGLVTGLIIGVVFNLYSLITIYTFSSYPIQIALIDFGANALIFMAAGLVMGSWRKYEEVPA